MPAKTAAAQAQRQGLKIRLPKQGGPIFLDNALEPADTPPTQIRVPVDYASRQPWIQVRGSRAVTRPGGPASDPFAKVHTFVHAEELVLVMDSGSYRYAIVGQPDKYDSAGVPSDVAGDPAAEVRWFYDADLIGKV